MKNYKGAATLSFPDGTTANGQVDIRYAATQGQMSGKGYFSTRDAMAIFGRSDNPVLCYDDFRIEVIIAEAGMEGATIMTTGAPL